MLVSLTTEHVYPACNLQTHSRNERAADSVFAQFLTSLYLALRQKAPLLAFSGG